MFKYFNNYFSKNEKYPCMKSSRFNLEELNCLNKDFDVGLDVFRHNLDLFLHKTCLLAEFTCHLRNIISLIWALFLIKMDTLIGLSKKSNKWTFVTQHIQVEMAKGQHWQNTIFDFQGCDFHVLYLFIFLKIVV